jgi:CPA2 family monovalent cation:H+ antiporter-2
MLINPQLVVQNLGIFFSLVTLIMVGKAAIILPIVLRFGYSLQNGSVGQFRLNQIGEFSFVLALEGFNLGLISEQRYSLLLGTTAITLLLTPLWINLAPKAAEQLDQIPVLQPYLKRLGEPKLLSVPEGIRDHIIVAGYGRVGQVLVNILLSQNYSVLVIENSEAAVRGVAQPSDSLCVWRC